MANQFKATITQVDGNPYLQPKDIGFSGDQVLIQENKNYPTTNLSFILSNGSKYYSTSTVDQLISLANAAGTEQVKATVLQAGGYAYQTPLAFGFPAKSIQINEYAGDIQGANSRITFDKVDYFAQENLDQLVDNSDIDPDEVSPDNPTATVGLTAKNGSAPTFMRSDAAPALDPTILTQTGEANKIAQLDNGGNLVLQNSTQRVEYGAASIFMYGPNASWLDIDASGMEIDLIAGGTTIHLGMDGIDAADQPITTTHVPTAAADLINKAYFDAQIANIPDGLTYKGSWNAATNTPTLANGVGANGDYYKVSVGGTRDLGGGSVLYSVGDHIVYVAGTDNKWENFGQSAPVPANPSVTVGLAAKNGTSGNFMRSDAAPALDQTIAPTWAGIHNFTANTGFGAAAPHAPIQTGNAIVNRKIVMFEAADNDHQFYGFGVNSNVLRYQTSGTTAAHVFYAATNTTTSNELFRIYGTGGYLAPKQSYIIDPAAGVKLWLGMYSSGTGHNNAPTAIGATSNYLQIGGREYGNNGYGGIGFGYVSGVGDHPCVWVGYQEKNTAGNTSGDFLVAVRNATTNTAPVEAFRIAQNKDASFSGNVNVQGNLSSAVNTNPASPTNSGVAIVGSPNNADIVMFDSTRAVDNRTCEMIFFQGAQQFRFKNDAGSSATTWLSAAGGQAAGVTGITSNSGTGTWEHTGALKTTKEAILSTGYTVATLPAASAALKGARAFVTDASVAAPAFMSAATGGGSNTVPVFCTGTAWVYA